MIIISFASLQVKHLNNERKIPNGLSFVLNVLRINIYTLEGENEGSDSENSEQGERINCGKKGFSLVSTALSSCKYC